MIKNILLAATMLLSILGLSVSVSAHHSAAAQFDVTQEFVLTGVLTELQEVNPHSIWHVDVKGEDGKVTSWKLEGVSPNGLRRKWARQWPRSRSLPLQQERSGIFSWRSPQ